MTASTQSNSLSDLETILKELDLAIQTAQLRPDLRAREQAVTALRGLRAAMLKEYERVGAQHYQ